MTRDQKNPQDIPDADLDTAIGAGTLATASGAVAQNDIDNGRLICEIGVAPLKPAEFVTFRIGQKTADAGLGRSSRNAVFEPNDAN